MKFSLKPIIVTVGLLAIPLVIFSALSLFWYYRLGLIQTYAVPKLEKIVGFPINAEVKNLSFQHGFTLSKVSLGPQKTPILRAEEVQIDIALGQYLLDFLKTGTAKEIDFSQIKITNAILSARQLEDGTLQFFPEVSKPSTGDRQTSKIEKDFKWLISKLKIVNSAIEFELRATKKQISVSKINLDLLNLGNDSNSKMNGSLEFFVRDFGIDRFEKGKNYPNAINAKLNTENCELRFSKNNKLTYANLKFFLNEIDAYINSVGIPTSNVEVSTQINNQESLELEGLQVLDQNKNLELKLILDKDLKYNFDLNIKKIDVGAISIFFDKLKDKNIRGNITELTMQGSFSKSSLLNIKDTLNSELKFKIDDIYLPRQLIEVAPFNIIFLPFTIISSTFTLIPNNVLPDDLINLGNSVASSLKDSQTFRLKNGDFKIDIKDKVLKLSEAKIGTDLTGDLYFGGTVDYDHNIEINSGVQLLGIRIPLPITGTLEDPYPDPVVFVTSIFTEFGLSIMRLPVTIIEEIGSWFESGDRKG